MGRGSNNILYQPVASGPLSQSRISPFRADSDWKESIFISREINWVPAHEKPFADSAEDYDLGFHRQHSITEHNRLVLSRAKTKFNYNFFVSQGLDQKIEINLEKYRKYLKTATDHHWSTSSFLPQAFFKYELKTVRTCSVIVTGFIQKTNDLQSSRAIYRKETHVPSNYLPLLQARDLDNDQNHYQGFDDSWNLIVELRGTAIEVPVFVTDLPVLPVKRLLLSKLCLRNN